MFLHLIIISFIIFIFNIFILHIILNKEYINKNIVYYRQLASAVNSLCISVIFTAGIFHLQSIGFHLLSTWNKESLYTDAIVLSFLFICIFTAIGSIIFDNFFSPIHTTSIIPKLEIFGLYLRSFENDSYLNVEYNIIREAKKQLQFFAIANPSTIVQKIKADRIFATDTEWQSAVSVLISKAQYTIIRIGISNGCKWELQHILTSNLCKKTIFLFRTKEEYCLLCKSLQSMGYGGMPILEFEESVMPLCAIFLKNDSKYDWCFASLHNQTEINKLFQRYLHLRPDYKRLMSQLKSSKDSLPKILSLKGYLKAYIPFSFSGLFPIPFLIIGKLKKTSLILSIIIIYLCLTQMILSKSTFPIIILFMFFTFYGKHMTIVSNHLASDVIADKRINFFCIICLITIALSCFFTNLYLNIYPNVVNH